MFRHPFVPVAALILAAGSLSAACSSETPAAAATPATPEPAVVTTAAVESRPIERHLRVTGSLLADEQAEVSAELAGRVTATPVERGTVCRPAPCWSGSPPPNRRRSSRKPKPMPDRWKRASG